MVRLRHFDVFWFIFLFLCFDQVCISGRISHPSLVYLLMKMFLSLIKSKK